MAEIIGVSVINTKGVFGALFNRPSPFIRTPKYNLQAGKKAGWQGKIYKSKFSMTLVFEVLLAAYISLALFYSIKHQQLASLPFIFLYWLGYMFIAGLSLAHALKK